LRGRDWRERCITVNRNGCFAFTDGAKVRADKFPVDAEDGVILEIRPSIERLMDVLTARASQAPLASLFIDYGHEATGFGDTLQAVRDHRYIDPLSMPGEADLTAHVDFAALRTAAEARGLKVYGPLPQSEFLVRLGLEIRRDRLLTHATPAQRDSILSGTARLTEHRQMGILFKALTVTTDGLAPPPPFGDI
jgi:NADH dehydrogenase [ubiquinone] 1 alpha subcomplex assembly factor 7